MFFADTHRFSFCDLVYFGVISEVLIVSDIFYDHLHKLEQSNQIVQNNYLLLQIFRESSLVFGLDLQLYLVVQVFDSCPQVALHYYVKAIEFHQVVVKNSLKFFVPLDCILDFLLVLDNFKVMIKPLRVLLIILLDYLQKFLIRLRSHIDWVVVQIETILINHFDGF